MSLLWTNVLFGNKIFRIFTSIHSYDIFCMHFYFPCDWNNCNSCFIVIGALGKVSHNQAIKSNHYCLFMEWAVGRSLYIITRWFPWCKRLKFVTHLQISMLLCIFQNYTVTEHNTKTEWVPNMEKLYQEIKGICSFKYLKLTNADQQHCLETQLSHRPCNLSNKYLNKRVPGHKLVIQWYVYINAENYFLIVKCHKIKSNIFYIFANTDAGHI